MLALSATDGELPGLTGRRLRDLKEGGRESYPMAQAITPGWRCRGGPGVQFGFPLRPQLSTGSELRVWLRRGLWLRVWLRSPHYVPLGVAGRRLSVRPGRVCRWRKTSRLWTGPRPRDMDQQLVRDDMERVG